MGLVLASDDGYISEWRTALLLAQGEVETAIFYKTSRHKFNIGELYIVAPLE